jgi:hypothetical protein
MHKQLHESISLSEKHASVSYLANVVWMNVLPHTDAFGHYRADPALIKAQCMPYFLSLRLEQIEEALNDLVKARLLHLYDSEGKKYLAYHDHEDWSPTAGFKYRKARFPLPPPGLCRCTGPKEERRRNGVGNADSSYSSLSHSNSPPDKRGLVGERRASQALAALWNDGPGEHLNGKSAGEKIQAAIDVGVSPQVIEQAFWDHQAIKGRKIWEVLDPLRPSQAPPGVKSMFQVLAEFDGGKP